MAMPHRDDMPRIVARRPDDDHHPAPKVSRRNKTRLAIVNARIGLAERIAREYFASVGKIEASFPQG